MIEMVKYSRGKASSRKASSRKGKKSSRKGRGASRRGASRKSRISRKMRMLMMRGGAQLYSPAGVDDATMMSSSKMNLAQGSDYQQIHANQHGGAAFDLNSSAPVGYTGVLDQSLRATAHLGPLDASLNSIRGMSDQSGGARRSKGRKSATRRAVAAIKKLKNMFKKMAKRGRAMMSRKRKQRGGSASSLAGAADYSSPGMLLSPAMENRALLGMHTQEWKLAADPTSFAPKMA